MATKCAVFKSAKKVDYYLYLNQPHPEQEADFSVIPDALSALLGELEFVMELELTRDRKLAQANVEEVISSLHTNGFYLQSPPRPEIIKSIENSKL